MLIVQPKIKALEEIVPPIEILETQSITAMPSVTIYLYTDDFPIDPKAREKIMAKGDPKARLGEMMEALRVADFSSDAALEQAIKATAAAHGLGFGDYQAPMRLAISGTNVGPNLTGILRFLGRDRVLRRIERFLGAV
jgi:glutamyl-tRNA synthetase